MTTFSHARARRQIERVFVRGPAHADVSRLFGHLASCATCTALYDEYAALEAGLSGGEADMRDDGSDLAATLASARAASVLAPRLVHVDRPRPTPVSRLAAAGTAVLAAAALAVVVLVVRPGHDDSARLTLAPGATFAPVAGELVPRGAAAADSDVGVRMFRVTGEISEARALSLDDVVTFTYTNAGSDLHYLALFGVQGGVAGERRVLWYEPEASGPPASVPMRTGEVDDPLGFGIRLAVEHGRGPLQVVALFSSAPLQRADIESLVTSERALPVRDLSTRLLARYSRIAGDGHAIQVLEHSFIVDIAAHADGVSP